MTPERRVAALASKDRGRGSTPGALAIKKSSVARQQMIKRQWKGMDATERDPPWP